MFFLSLLNSTSSKTYVNCEGCGGLLDLLARNTEKQDRAQKEGRWGRTEQDSATVLVHFLNGLTLRIEAQYD